MGSQDHIVQLKQRIVLDRRFLSIYLKSGSGYHLLLQCRNQISLINNFSPRGVDEKNGVSTAYSSSNIRIQSLPRPEVGGA